MPRRSVIIGTGSALPPGPVTNADLEQQLDTSDAWIVERTGIRERRIAAPHVKTSDLAVEAALNAMAAAGVGPADIDLVIVATATPDDTFPATATRVQARLGIGQGQRSTSRRSARASSMRSRWPTRCCAPAPTAARW